MAAAPCSFLSIPNSHSSPKLIYSSSSSLYPYASLSRRGLMRSNTTPSLFLLLHTSNNKNNTNTPRPPAATDSASSSSVLLPDAIPEQQDTDATSTIISALLFIAFVGLSILTIGVIYIAVTDFLQKREGEKFQKEQAEKNKKSGGKKRLMKARAGPKGFGQKIVEGFSKDGDVAEEAMILLVHWRKRSRCSCGRRSRRGMSSRKSGEEHAIKNKVVVVRVGLGPSPISIYLCCCALSFYLNCYYSLILNIDEEDFGSRGNFCFVHSFCHFTHCTCSLLLTIQICNNALCLSP